MAGSPTIKNDTVAAVLKEFPDISSNQAASIAYDRNPALFKDKEAARGIARYLRGSTGAKARKDSAVRLPPSPFTTRGFEEFPDGKVHVEKWGPVQVNGPKTVLVMPDLHIPYHDRPAVMATIECGLEAKADVVLLNGDTADFHSVSFWQTDPRQRDLKGELKAVRQFLYSLRKTFPKARIIYKLGNHEERWIRFIIQKAPEIYGLEEIGFGPLLHLGEHRIELVEDKRLVRLGDLNVLHGHEYRFSISNPVNPARGIFLRCKAHALASHFHQVSHHSEKTVEGGSIATWSTGCLCNLTPDYAPYNAWSHGFAIVKVAANNKFTVENKVIKNGVVY